MEQNKKGHRLILFPFPVQGHVNPMLELANLLHFRGFSITIIHTNFNPPNPSNHPNFTFLSIPDGLSESETSTKNTMILLSRLNANCHDPFRDCLTNLLSDDCPEEPISCLITDSQFRFTQSVAKSFKLPVMLLRTTSAATTVVYASYPLLFEKGYLPKQESQLEEAVVELPPLKVKDLPILNSIDTQRAYQLITQMVNEVNTSDGVIFNTSEDLEDQALATIEEKLPIPIFPIGPFHKWFPTSSSSSLLSEDESCMSWLDTQAPNSVVYVSFGSTATINDAQFLEIAWGLVKANQPFLWVVRLGLVQGSKWLEKLPQGYLEQIKGKGHIVKWAPQKRVLAHPAVGLFLTHNGWNSTFEAISEGVPMICMPFFADQMVNARYVSDVWRVGVQLEKGIKRGEVEEAIRKMMGEKEGEEIKENMSKLKEKTILSLREGGSSYQALDCLVNHILPL